MLHLLNIHKRERQLTLGMVLLNLLFMSAIYLIKPARDGIFLIELGYEQLPWIYIIVAIISTPITLFLSQTVQKLNIYVVIRNTLLFGITSLAAIWLLLQWNTTWAVYLFYIWISLYGVMLISEYWLLANTLMDASQSKRIFVLLNIGAIAGAVAGSGLSTFLVGPLGFRTDILILFGAGVLVPGIVLVRRLWLTNNPGDTGSSEMGEAEPLPVQEGLQSSNRPVLSSSYPLLIIGIIATVALKSMRTGSDVSRIEETRGELRRLALAIAGDPELVSG
ncbi:MAG: hypothetical protein R3281_14630, partial [Balneolaceae bacterium]|nr:hypothetical protein [Balneolaceae bacterium]